MLEKYRHLIYKSDNERKQIEQQVFEDCFTAYPELSANDYTNITDNNLPPDFKCLYYNSLAEYEGGCLFNIAVEKFGRKLWLNGAWQRNMCRIRCPFGNICRKELYEYDGNRYCYGQIYLRLSPNSNEILKSDSLYVSIYENFISEFGGKDSNGNINGRNVIPFL